MHNLGRGKTSMMQDPDLGLITYGIDARGLQWQQQNPNQRAAVPQQSTTFQHDLLDRMTVRIEPDPESHWVYDEQSERCYRVRQRQSNRRPHRQHGPPAAG